MTAEDIVLPDFSSYGETVLFAVLLYACALVLIGVLIAFGAFLGWAGGKAFAATCRALPNAFRRYSQWLHKVYVRDVISHRQYVRTNKMVPSDMFADFRMFNDAGLDVPWSVLFRGVEMSPFRVVRSAQDIDNSATIEVLYADRDDVLLRGIKDGDRVFVLTYNLPLDRVQNPHAVAKKPWEFVEPVTSDFVYREKQKTTEGPWRVPDVTRESEYQL